MSASARTPRFQAKKSQLHSALNTSCSRNNVSACRFGPNPPQRHTSQERCPSVCTEASILDQKSRAAAPKQAGQVGCRRTWPVLKPRLQRQKQQSSPRASRPAPGSVSALKVTASGSPLFPDDHTLPLRTASWHALGCCAGQVATTIRRHITGTSYTTTIEIKLTQRLSDHDAVPRSRSPLP